MQLKEKRWLVARHEAGHAVAQWLFGLSIDGVTMQVSSQTPADGMLGYMTAQNRYDPRWLVSVKNINRTHARKMATRQIAILFAGPVAELFLFHDDDEEDRADWLLALMLGWISEGKPPSSDIGKAIALANVFYPELSGNQWRYLGTIAKWTEELFAEWQVTGATVALAKRLTRTKTIDGAAAFRTIQRAWNPPVMFPITALGPKWRRRFPCP